MLDLKMLKLKIDDVREIFPGETDHQLKSKTNKDLGLVLINYLAPLVAEPQLETAIKHFKILKCLLNILLKTRPSDSEVLIRIPRSVILAVIGLSNTPDAHLYEKKIQEWIKFVRIGRGITKTNYSLNDVYTNIHGICITIALLFLLITFIQSEIDPELNRRMKKFFQECLLIFQKKITESKLPETEAAKAQEILTNIAAWGPEPTPSPSVAYTKTSVASPIGTARQSPRLRFLHQLNASPTNIICVSYDRIAEIMWYIGRKMTQADTYKLSMLFIGLEKDFNRSHALGLTIKRQKPGDFFTVVMFDPNLGNPLKYAASTEKDFKERMDSLIIRHLPKEIYYAVVIFIVDSALHKPHYRLQLNDTFYLSLGSFDQSLIDNTVFLYINHVCKHTNDSTLGNLEDAIRIISHFRQIINNNFGPNNSTFLSIATEMGNTRIVKAILSVGGRVDIPAGPTWLLPLVYAVDNCHINGTDLILRAGADPNAIIGKGQTCLMIAVRKRLLKIVQLLLAANANVNKQDENGFTALFFLVDDPADPVAMEILDILLGAGADPNLQNKIGCTPLHYACGKGHVQYIKPLLLAEANPDLKSQEGETPLALARILGQAESVKTLQELLS